MSALEEYRAYRVPDNVEEARHRKALRGVAVYPMPIVREGAPLEEWAAWLEADQTNRDYMSAYREHGFMHPIVTALSEYRAVSQAVHGRMEYTNAHRAEWGDA